MYTPPSGSQPPYNNQPQYGAPPNMVPPNQRKSGGGCWLWGGLGCLLLIILVVGGSMFAAYKAIHSKSGGILSSMGSVMKGASDIADDMQKAKAVKDALVKYKADNGQYPDSLSDLAPKYLPDQSALHLQSDPNTDPSHDSFDYTKPAANASGTTPLFSFTADIDMDLGGEKEDVATKYTFLINGTINEDQTQTMTTPDGKTTTTTTHMNGMGAESGSGFPGMSTTGGMGSGSSSP